MQTFSFWIMEPASSLFSNQAWIKEKMLHCLHCDRNTVRSIELELASQEMIFSLVSQRMEDK